MSIPLRSMAHARLKLHRLISDSVELNRDPLARLEQKDGTRPIVKEPLPTPGPGPVDLIIENARLFLEDGSAKSGAAKNGATRSIGVKDGLIVGVGETAQFETGAGTEYLDAGGKTLLPGFCDSHVHLLMAAERLAACDLEPVTTFDEMVESLQKHAAEDPDAPVLYANGLHYLDPPLVAAERARHVLDEIIPDRPLLIYAHDLHTVWCNTKALEEAELFHKMPPYPEYLEHLRLTENLVLGADGMPSGEIREPETYFLAEAALKMKYPLDRETRLTMLKTACEQLAGYGITAVHNMSLGVPEEDLECCLMLLELDARRELPVRVYTAMAALPDEHMFRDLETAAKLRDVWQDAEAGKTDAPRFHERIAECLGETIEVRHTSFSDESGDPKDHHSLKRLFNISDFFRRTAYELHLRPHHEEIRNRAVTTSELPRSRSKVDVGLVKLFMDGVVEKGTAYRLDEKPLDNIPAFDAYRLGLLMTAADRLGLQTASHAIGDGSVSAVLNAVDEARSHNAENDAARGHKVRHRVEHIELCTPETIPRFAELEAIASMQPFHERPPMTLWHQLVPRDRWATAFPWRSLRERGTVLVFGSDWPIVSCDCVEAAEHVVERRPWSTDLPEQELSLSDALECFTTNAAFVAGCENRRGKIEPGMAADMVILNTTLAADADRFPETAAVAMTICDGRVTFEREGSEIEHGLVGSTR